MQSISQWDKSIALKSGYDVNANGIPLCKFKSVSLIFHENKWKLLYFSSFLRFGRILWRRFSRDFCEIIKSIYWIYMDVSKVKELPYCYSINQIEISFQKTICLELPRDENNRLIIFHYIFSPPQIASLSLSFSHFLSLYLGYNNLFFHFFLGFDTLKKQSPFVGCRIKFEMRLHDIWNFISNLKSSHENPPAPDA